MPPARPYKIQDLINLMGRLIPQQVGREQPFNAFERSIGEYGAGFFPQLKDSIEHPTLSPAFQLYSKEGLDQLRGAYSLGGNPSSGQSQLAGGRFMEGLTARAVDDANQRLMAAASGFRGILPQSQIPNFTNSGSGAFNAKTNLLNAMTAMKASSGGGGGMGFSSPLGSLSGMLGGSMMDTMTKGTSQNPMIGNPQTTFSPMDTSQGGLFQQFPGTSNMSGMGGSYGGTGFFNWLSSFWGS